jgi:hypothetical protein
MKRASATTLLWHVAAWAACTYFLWRAEQLFGSPHANTLAFGGRYEDPPPLCSLWGHHSPHSARVPCAVWRVRTRGCTGMPS